MFVIPIVLVFDWNTPKWDRGNFGGEDLYKHIRKKKPNKKNPKPGENVVKFFWFFSLFSFLRKTK